MSGKDNSGSSTLRNKELCSEMAEAELREHLPESFTSRRCSAKKETRINHNEDSEIHRMFQKKFKLKDSTTEWFLPENDVMFRDTIWKIPELHVMKEELNAVKSKLNDFDMEEWHRHTNSMNKAGSVLWKLRNDYEPEFVTQAWCKFYEIAMSYPLIPPMVIEQKCFNSVHLSEAPGAFITSLNHFLNLHHPHLKWNWRATTLNPYYEGNTLSSMINDDRFIFHTISYWTFGHDYTGDITHMDNIFHLVQETRKIGDILLVTADGSIDCQDNPAEQEFVVSFLHYCETIAALYILSQGGSFVLKIFTTYEAQNVCLLYLLCCAFHQVNLFKPATSKEGNSEVYVICLDYKGKEYMDPWLGKMKNYIESEFKSHVLFPLEYIPQNFIGRLLLCSKMYKNLQVETIQSNIQMYGVSSNNYKIKRIKYLTAQYFMQHYEMDGLCDKSKEIVGGMKLKEALTMNLDSQVRRGSFSEMMQQKVSDAKSKWSRLLEEISNIGSSWGLECDIKWLKLQTPLVEFNMVTGKAINTVCSSKFCSRRLLQVWNNVREATVHMSVSCSNDPSCRDISKLIANNVSKDGSFLTTDLKTLNINTEYWCSLEGSTNNKVEKEAFIEIMNFISDLQNGESFLLCGYPLLTQFNVGIIYLLSNLFDKVGFINPSKYIYSIVFVKFLHSNTKVLQNLNEIRNVCSDLKSKKNEESVVSVVAIDKLCGKHFKNVKSCSTNPKRTCLRKETLEHNDISPAFYCCVTEMNNTFVKDYASKIISGLIESSIR